MPTHDTVVSVVPMAVRMVTITLMSVFQNSLFIVVRF